MRFDWRLASLALVWPCRTVDGRITRMRRLLRAAHLTKRSTQCAFSHASSGYFAQLGNATLEDGGDGSFVIGPTAAPTALPAAARCVSA